jgi:hypothetical protein
MVEANDASGRAEAIGAEPRAWLRLGLLARGVGVAPRCRARANAWATCGATTHGARTRWPSHARW